MSWEELEKTKEDSGGKFLKIKDGEDVVGVFFGEPRTFYKNFETKQESKSRSQGLSFRFQVNFIVKENGQYVAKILEQGSRFRNSLLDVKEEYGLDCVYKIKRTGSSQEDTRYSILFKENLTPEQLDEINKVKLNILNPQLEGKPLSWDDEGFPFP